MALGAEIFLRFFSVVLHRHISSVISCTNERKPAWLLDMAWKKSEGLETVYDALRRYSPGAGPATAADGA
jgi:hypothetical protein